MLLGCRVTVHWSLKNKECLIKNTKDCCAPLWWKHSLITITPLKAPTDIMQTLGGIKRTRPVFSWFTIFASHPKAGSRTTSWHDSSLESCLQGSLWSAYVQCAIFLCRRMSQWLRWKAGRKANWNIKHKELPPYCNSIWQAGESSAICIICFHTNSSSSLDQRADKLSTINLGLSWKRISSYQSWKEKRFRSLWNGQVVIF